MVSLPSKLFLVTAIALCTAKAGAQEHSVPHEFEANTPAIAAEVNENFGYITTQLDDITQAEFSTDVNCAEDPWALGKAYNRGVHFSELNMRITAGSCYGDFQLRLDEQGNVITDENDYALTYQVQGQSVHVYSATAERMGLEPNPYTGVTNLGASFGGGLYLSGLNITLGEQDYAGVLFSRNAHGDIYNASIVGHGSEAGATGIVVQEGAQVYLSDVQLSELNRGITGVNGATIRFLGPIDIATVVTGIEGSQTNFRQLGEINIAATGSTLSLLHGSAWLGWGMPINTYGAPSYINDGSVLELGTFSSDNALSVGGGQALVDYLDVSELNVADTSRLQVYEGSVGGTTRVSGNSTANLGSMNVNQIELYGSSLLSGSYSAANAMVYDSKLEGNGASFSEDVLVERSQLALFDSTFSTSLRVVNSSGYLGPNTNIDINNIECSGATTLDLDGVDLLADAPNSRCLSVGDFNHLVDLVQQQRGL